jgi:hypothetical protein
MTPELSATKTRGSGGGRNFFAPFVQWAYGARFDRNTLEHVRRASKLKLLGTRFLKHDTYLLIEGQRSD